MTGNEARTASQIRRCPMTGGRPSDMRLAAVIESKPAVDEVPLEAWWHLADCLRQSVPVRRAREGIEVLDAAALQRATHQAIWSAQAALAHLGEGTSTRTPDRPGPPNVRATMRDLARLIVSPRATPLEALRGSVLDHLEALGAPGSPAR
jgi:hypothetical protein